MKILFLDHDQVIATKNSYSDPNIWFDSECIKVLNSIITTTNCEIVVSSQWRIHYSLKSMQDIYEESDILKQPIDYTPDLWIKEGGNKYSTLIDMERIRTKEILTWLDSHCVINWCAIDDMILNLNNFVFINSDKGLNNEHFEKIAQFYKI